MSFNNQNDLESELQKRSIRPTAMRLRVLKHLKLQSAAVSLTDLEQSFERADRTTLYRTLKTFEDRGLIHRIVDDAGNARYALCSRECSCSYPEDLHAHFYCNRCEEMFCLTRTKIPAVDLPQNFLPQDANLVIKGMCAQCSH